MKAKPKTLASHSEKERKEIVRHAKEKRIQGAERKKKIWNFCGN